MKKIRSITIVAITLLVLGGCSLIKSITNEISNFAKLQFKLDNVNNFTLNNVKLSNLSTMSDISATDILALTKAVANKQLPVTFTLNVLASNPNNTTTTTTGTSVNTTTKAATAKAKTTGSNTNTTSTSTSTTNTGTKTTSKGSGLNYDAVIEGLDWILYIDNVKTVSGKVTTPVTVPTGNSSTIIPVNINLDLYEFFGNQGLNNLINLALSIGGVSGSASKLQLKAKPTVKIAGVPISYPSYITVVNTEFRDK